MQGVVSLLDDHHYALTESLWAGLERRFGLHGIYVTPFPHFSYHVALRYQLERLEPVVEQAARSLASFRVKTAGLGVFAGPQPILYLPVVRSESLSRLHRELWQAVSPVAEGPVAHYRPESWIPHITLAQFDLAPHNLPQVVDFLNGRELNWEIVIDNLAILADTHGPHELHARRNFGR
jgi:2'-5' RNA ligase